MRLIVFIVWLVPIAGFGQDTIVVGSFKTHRLGINYFPNASIEVIGTSGTAFTREIDSYGKFAFTDQELREGESYVLTIKSIEAEPQFYNRTARLLADSLFRGGSPYELNIRIDESNCLDHFSSCPTLPIVCFEYNTTQIKDGMEGSIQILTRLLHENSGIVLELIGKADIGEMAPRKLARNRAQIIQRLLVETGIEKARLKIVNCGSSKPHVVDRELGGLKKADELTDQYLQSLQNPIDIENARMLNGSTEIKILRTDYVPKGK